MSTRLYFALLCAYLRCLSVSIIALQRDYARVRWLYELARLSFVRCEGWPRVLVGLRERAHVGLFHAFGSYVVRGIVSYVSAFRGELPWRGAELACSADTSSARANTG